MHQYLTISEVARELGVSKDSVRVYADSGRLRARRTNTGLRLFAPRDVAQFNREREHTKVERRDGNE
jgi:excisionase family DNA binding protein